jgi:hypothetical protein
MTWSAVDQNHIMVGAQLSAQIRRRDHAAATTAEDEDFLRLDKSCI